MRAIEQCRTEVLDGQVYSCPEYGEVLYSYHSCHNRHCPKCQNDKTQEWLEAQQDLFLAVVYFMLTFTLPAALNEIVRSHQTLLYNLLFLHTAFGKRHPFRWRSGRPGGYPTYLGAQSGLPPAHPLPGSGRRPGSWYPYLAACPAGVLAASQGALENLPRQVQAGIAQDSSLHADSRQGLAAGLGGGR